MVCKDISLVKGFIKKGFKVIEDSSAGHFKDD